MSKTEVSILLEILDLEYLKPILINRFENLDQLASVNLHDIGIQNDDDRTKLRYALDELQGNKNPIEHYDPILSLNDSHHIITRIENEANLISSSLNLLFNTSNNSNLPIDDATSDIDYSLYNSDIDQIEADVEHLQKKTEQIIERIQQQQPLNENQLNSNQFLKGTLFILALSVLSIGFMFYIKRK
jgi:hypothetical protein